MTKFLQTLIDALSVGSMYALIALGYTMVYGILKFINFAHANIVMLGGWLAFAIAAKLGWGKDSPALAFPMILLCVMATCATIAFVIEKIAYKPLRSAPRLNVLITAIGVSLFLENFCQLKYVFGASPQRMPSLLPEGALFQFAGVSVLLVDVICLVVTIALMVALEWLVFRTNTGRAMRAVSFSTQNASLMGINPNRIISITFVIGSALAAAAGLLFGMKYPGLNQPAHSTWMLLGLKAFVAAVVGGIGNINGAVVGALLIGGIELFGAAYLSPHLRDVYVFAILIVVLLVRPSGLFGSTIREKV